MSRDRTGTLIIRAWIEQDSSAPLRAHVRQTTDVSAGFLDGKTVTDEGAAAELVRRWLKAVLRDAAPPTEATTTP
jgi:hypothetical protein